MGGGVDVFHQPVRHLHQPLKGKWHLDQRHRAAGDAAGHQRLHVELAAHAHAAQVRLHALDDHRSPAHQRRAGVERRRQRDRFRKERIRPRLRRPTHRAHRFRIRLKGGRTLDAGDDLRRRQFPYLQFQTHADQKDHVAVFILRLHMLHLAGDAAGHVSGRAGKLEGVVELRLRRQRAQRRLLALPVDGLTQRRAFQHHAPLLHVHLTDDQRGFGHQRFDRVPARAGHDRLRAQKRLPLPRTDQFLDLESLLKHAYRHRKNLPTAFRFLCLCVGRNAHARGR